MNKIRMCAIYSCTHCHAQLGSDPNDAFDVKCLIKATEPILLPPGRSAHHRTEEMIARQKADVEASITAHNASSLRLVRHQVKRHQDAKTTRHGDIDAGTLTCSLCKTTMLPRHTIGDYLTLPCPIRKKTILERMGLTLDAGLDTIYDGNLKNLARGFSSLTQSSRKPTSRKPPVLKSNFATNEGKYESGQRTRAKRAPSDIASDTVLAADGKSRRLEITKITPPDNALNAAARLSNSGLKRNPTDTSHDPADADRRKKKQKSVARSSTD